MDSPPSASVSAGSLTGGKDGSSPNPAANPAPGLITRAPPGTVSPSSSSSASSNPPASANPITDVDPQILEALRSKDRIYVLKLGEQFEALIKERRPRVELNPATSYQRLLVHRCSAYYKLQPENDPVTKVLYVIPTLESKIPERRICELVPVELPNQPAIKIMKRAPDTRKPRSHAGSIAGEDADLSDVEPSEAGSLGGQSNITSSSSKKRMTIEQREAAYNEARSRIFMGFEEKEKNKEKDMSASSSSMSVSGSTSTSAGRSSGGETDDIVSSPATESEWSTPGTFSRDNKRRVGGSGGASSTRSLRSGGSFHGNGSGSSSRNSRAASPSFSYASLYEPPPSGHSFDGSQHPPPNMGYYPPQYGYPYPQPNQGHNQPFVHPYPYYGNPTAPYQSPPPMQPPNPSSPPGPDPYSPPPANYGQPYAWSPLQSPPQGMVMTMPPHSQPPQRTGPQQLGPMSAPPHLPPHHGPPTHTPSYPPYGAYGYPYYPPHPILSPGQHHASPPTMPPPPQHPHMGMHLQHQAQPGYEMPRNLIPNPMMHQAQSDFAQSNQFPHNSVGGPGPHNGVPNGALPTFNGSSERNKKSGPFQPPTNRSAWSFGPGISQGGFPTSTVVGNSAQFVGNGLAGTGETVGPRFINSNRRTSGHSNSGGNSRASSNCDDVSSIASSSTTSSSSRRTFTSTSSQQQHPLPPRPDWAVGMKAQPTLAGRHHDQHSLNNSRNLSPISPASNSTSSSISNTGNNSPRPPGLSGLSSPSDFPPLMPSGMQEKRGTMPSGAWGASRPVVSPSLSGSSSGLGAAAVNIPQSPRSGTGEDGKIAEMYTPKLIRRTTPGTGSSQPLPLTSPVASTAALAGHMTSMSLADNAIDALTLPTQASSHVSATPATLA